MVCGEPDDNRRFNQAEDEAGDGGEGGLRDWGKGWWRGRGLCDWGGGVVEGGGGRQEVVSRSVCPARS